MEETDVDGVSKQLDQLVAEYFSTLGEILLQQRALESHMKEGFLCMSSARKSMGFKRIGTAQYDLGAMQADVVVDVQKHDGVVTFQKYEDRDNADEEEEGFLDKEGLRKRKPNIGTKDSDVEEITKSVQELNVKSSGDEGAAKKDPISMFGVLVPQSLKQSQARFKSALDLTVSLSSLRARLLKVKAEYQELLEQKKELLRAHRGVLLSDEQDEGSAPEQEQ